MVTVRKTKINRYVMEWKVIFSFNLLYLWVLNHKQFSDFQSLLPLNKLKAHSIILSSKRWRTGLQKSTENLRCLCGPPSWFFSEELKSFKSKATGCKAEKQLFSWALTSRIQNKNFSGNLIIYRAPPSPFFLRKCRFSQTNFQAKMWKCSSLQPSVIN